MGVRIRLEDGGLYETIDGDRFRVRYNPQTRHFDCKACNRSWCMDGIPTTGSGYVGWVIAREVPEYRWVSINQDDLLGGDIFRLHRGHYQKQVTRQEAQRLAPNYQPPEQILTVTNHLDARIESVRQGDRDFLRIITPGGKVHLIEV